MKRFPANQQFVAWIAALAILFGALMPTLALAGMGQPDTLLPGAEICHSGDSSAPSKAPGDPAGQHAKHCQLCVIHAGSAALPPPAMPDHFPAMSPESFPRLFYQAPTPLFIWAGASPRGPPHVS